MPETHNLFQHFWKSLRLAATLPLQQDNSEEVKTQTQRPTSTAADYQKRVDRVVEYIDNHLAEQFDLEKLAEISYFSKWHFQRIMKAFLGEPIGTFIQRNRVETAAKLLRHTDLPVSAIAYEVGYDTPSSLSKVFQSFYGFSPSEYRNNKNLAIMKPVKFSDALNLKAPKIMTFEPRPVIYISLRGGYNSLDFAGAWGRLWQFVKEQGLYSAGIEHVGIYHDDPKATAEAELRSDICLVVPKLASVQLAETDDIRIKTIAGGKYAMFLYTGPYSGLGAAYDAIYGKWLPENCGCGCENCYTPHSGGCPPECPDCECECILRNEPCFERYANDPAKTAPEKLKTEIYLPIR